MYTDKYIELHDNTNKRELEGSFVDVLLVCCLLVHLLLFVCLFVCLFVVITVTGCCWGSISTEGVQVWGLVAC